MPRLQGSIEGLIDSLLQPALEPLRQELDSKATELAELHSLVAEAAESQRKELAEVSRGGKRCLRLGKHVA